MASYAKKGEQLMIFRITTLAILVTSAIAACGDSSSVDTCSTASGDIAGNDSLSITAAIDPDPPMAGQSTMQIIVKGDDGAGVTGLELTVDPQMPMHGHGSSEIPMVTDDGGGNYTAFPVTFTMPGAWEVTVSTCDDATGDSGVAVLSYIVQ